MSKLNDFAAQYQRDFVLQTKHFLMSRVMLNYKIMRCRAKISFKSMLGCEVVLKHVFQNIIRTYIDFNPVQANDIKDVKLMWEKIKPRTYT